MSIFDKIEYLKNTGKINYEDFTIKSAIALNSRRFQAYKKMRDNATTKTATKTRAISQFRNKVVSGKVIDFSRKISDSFQYYDSYPKSTKVNTYKKTQAQAWKNIC